MSFLKGKTAIITGSSRGIGLGIAKKLLEISKHTQVFSITHLPIVAAVADNHIFISKKIVNDRTVTDVKELDQENRVTAIAKMISPNDESGVNMPTVSHTQILSAP